eukprot:Polyplicarium_translucidae@DN5188_c0_g1_i1.p1
MKVLDAALAHSTKRPTSMPLNCEPETAPSHQDVREKYRVPMVPSDEVVAVYEAQGLSESAWMPVWILPDGRRKVLAEVTMDRHTFLPIDSLGSDLEETTVVYGGNTTTFKRTKRAIAIDVGGIRRSVRPLGCLSGMHPILGRDFFMDLEDRHLRRIFEATTGPSFPPARRLVPSPIPDSAHITVYPSARFRWSPPPWMLQVYVPGDGTYNANFDTGSMATALKKTLPDSEAFLFKGVGQQFHGRRTKDPVVLNVAGIEREVHVATADGRHELLGTSFFATLPAEAQDWLLRAAVNYEDRRVVKPLQRGEEHWVPHRVREDVVAAIGDAQFSQAAKPPFSSQYPPHVAHRLDRFEVRVEMPELGTTATALFDTGSEVTFLPVALVDGDKGEDVRYSTPGGTVQGKRAKRSVLVRCNGIERRIFPIQFTACILGRDFFGDLPFEEIEKLYWTALRGGA